MVYLTHSAMPCRSEEEFAQGPEESEADAPRTLPRRGVIENSRSYAEESGFESDSDAEI